MATSSLQIHPHLKRPLTIFHGRPFVHMMSSSLRTFFFDVQRCRRQISMSYSTLWRVRPLKRAAQHRFRIVTTYTTQLIQSQRGRFHGTHSQYSTMDPGLKQTFPNGWTKNMRFFIGNPTRLSSLCLGTKHLTAILIIPPTDDSRMANESGATSCPGTSVGNKQFIYFYIHDTQATEL